MKVYNFRELNRYAASLRGKYKPELKQLAKLSGFTGYSKLRRDALIKLLLGV